MGVLLSLVGIASAATAERRELRRTGKMFFGVASETGREFALNRSNKRLPEGNHLQATHFGVETAAWRSRFAPAFGFPRPVKQRIF